MFHYWVTLAPLLTCCCLRSNEFLDSAVEIVANFRIMVVRKCVIRGMVIIVSL